MTTLALSREEFIALMATEEDRAEEWRAAELRRLAKCARLAREIAAIVDKPQHRGKAYRQIAASLGPAQGTELLMLIDELENESREYRHPPQQPQTNQPKGTPRWQHSHQNGSQFNATLQR